MILCTFRISPVRPGPRYRIGHVSVNSQVMAWKLWPYGQRATRSSRLIALPTMARRSIDPYNGRPLYRQLADILRDAIRKGELRPGVTLPTLQRLADDYELGVDAVRDALAVLRGEGLIETERGKPARVRALPEPVEVKVQPGARITTRTPTEEERRRLQIPEGTPLLIVERNGQTDLYSGDRTVIETVDDLPD